MKKYILPLVLFFQMALLFTEVPAWVVLTSFVFLGVSLIPWIKKFRHLKLMTGIVSIIVVLIAVRQFSFVLSNELIASLLIILTSIRLIEHGIDVNEPPYFLFLLGLFLAVVKFVFQIDFIFGVYAFLATLFYLYQFFPENFQKHHTKESFRILRTIIAYSVPVTVLLFLVFPQFKFEGGQRNYGLFSSIGASGFSGELRPGSISELVNNENIAFRAEFVDFVPDQNKLYWRGQVLDRPQGLAWRRTNPLNRTLEEESEEDWYTYQPSYKIVLEPHYKEQLFTLYETTSVKSADKLLVSEKNNTYALSSVLSERLVYNGYVQLNVTQKLTTDRAEYLHLNRRSAKVEELLKTLASVPGSAQNTEQKVQLLAKHFAADRFKYRLSGQELAVNSLEEFLFKTKVGYCEHYASAAALVLRHWGVPARVVVGYQGGEFNRAGNFWTIKQQDAHAWVEYLNEKNSWVLFDPIITIAPERIMMGATLFLNPTGSGQFFKQLGKEYVIFDQLANLMEIYNYRWTLFFVEYSSANLKNEILKFYEANEDVQLAARLIFLLVCIYIVYGLAKKYLFRERPLNERYFLELHRFFSEKLPQQKNETFADWKVRLEQKYPDAKEAIERIFDIYLRNRYGAELRPSEFKQFKSLLNEKSFKH